MSVPSTHKLSFISKLLFSNIVLVLVCIFFMSILSSNLLGGNIKNQSIQSSNKLLNQFKTTADTLLLENINQMSITILQDTSTNQYISYYLSHELAGSTCDITSVSNYLNTMKTINPLIYSLSIYFSQNELLVSTEFVRHTLYADMASQEDLLYYSKLANIQGSSFWYVDHNYNFAAPPEKKPSSIIHLVRKIPGAGKTGNRSDIIVVSVKEDVFYNLLKKSAPEDFDEIVIIDDTGMVISHTDKKYLGHNINEFSYGNMVITSKEAAGYFIDNTEKTPSVVSYCNSKYNNWRYITVVPIVRYNNTTGFVIKIIITLALISIVLGVLISIISAHKLSVPVEKLAELCRGILGNSLSGSKNEYYIIQSAIDNLSEGIQEKEDKLRKFLPFIKMNFIQDLLSDKSMDIREIRSKMELLDIRLPYENFCVLSIETKKLCSSDAVIEYEIEKMGIASHLEEAFSTKHTVCLFSERENIITAIINFDIDEKRLHELIESLFSYKNFLSPVKIFVSIGEIVNDITLLSGSYKTSLAGLKYSFIYPEKQIFYTDDIHSYEQKSGNPEKYQTGCFNSALKKLSRSETLQAFDRLLASIRSSSYNYDYVMKTLSACITILEGTAANASIHLDHIMTDSSDMTGQMNKMEDILEFEEWLKVVINYMFDCIDGKHLKKNKEIVEMAREYINQNIQSSQLSLNAVADALYISPGYLSRIFRNETGMTFVDFVTGLKLDYSKNLLMTTSLKVDEISSMMGYSTSQYFISRFKIKYGLTPKEYRSKNSLRLNFKKLFTELK